MKGRKLMTLPSEVPEDQIIVEGVGGHWTVMSHYQPVERFETRAEAVARANEIAIARPIHLTVIVKLAPGPNYK
jgi:hypothetical protein